MKRKGLIILLLFVLVTALYLIQISKIETIGESNLPTLDNLHTDDISKNWEPFYKVRATLIDGQSARFSIPKEIKDKEGEKIQLTGAPVFNGNGCELVDDNTTKVDYFYLLPTLGLAQACVLQPDIAMRWTIRVNLASPWILSRNDMINAMVTVSGIFKTDTSNPYEAVFFVNNASVKLMPDK